MSVLASFHLTRYPARHAVRSMAGRAADHRSLAATPGLRFARQLGTGRGSSMGLGVDLTRWAIFAVWEEEAALDAFLATSPVVAAWRTRGQETWSVCLAPLAAHGTWGGQDPLREVSPAATPRQGTDESVAVLTRAKIPMRHWRAFYAAVPAVEADLRSRPGLLAALGIGEAPVGRLATFSLWRAAADVEAFAYGPSPHHAVVGRTRQEGWFAEELFARFRPYGSAGTWDGRDPLAGLAGGKGS